MAVEDPVECAVVVVRIVVVCDQSGVGRRNSIVDWRAVFPHLQAATIRRGARATGDTSRTTMAVMADTTATAVVAATSTITVVTVTTVDTTIPIAMVNTIKTATIPINTVTTRSKLSSRFKQSNNNNNYNILHERLKSRPPAPQRHDRKNVSEIKVKEICRICNARSGEMLKMLMLMKITFRYDLIMNNE